MAYQKMFHKPSNHVVEVVSRYKSTTLIHHEAAGSSYIVPNEQLEQLASDYYTVGDKVRTKNFFQGEVTGFEAATNRVICKSTNRPNGVRERFAYRPDEIEKCPDVKFIIGEKYKLHTHNGAVLPVIALEALSDDHLLLYNRYTWELFGAAPKEVTSKWLKDNAITHIEIVRR